MGKGNLLINKWFLEFLVGPSGNWSILTPWFRPCLQPYVRGPRSNKVKLSFNVMTQLIIFYP